MLFFTVFIDLLISSHLPLWQRQGVRVVVRLAPPDLPVEEPLPRVPPPPLPLPLLRAPFVLGEVVPAVAEADVVDDDRAGAEHHAQALPAAVVAGLHLGRGEKRPF